MFPRYATPSPFSPCPTAYTITVSGPTATISILIPPRSNNVLVPPPTWLSPERHTLALLLCTAITLLSHPRILKIISSWAAYLLWPSRPLLCRLSLLTTTIHIPALLRPPSPPNIRTDSFSPFPSPYWATTLHLLLLQWQAPRRVWVARTAVVSYTIVFLMLAWLPAAAGEELLVGWVIPQLATLGSLYLRSVLATLAVRLLVWAAVDGVLGVVALPAMGSLFLLVAEPLYFFGDVFGHAAEFLSSLGW
ncbi:uncharacterized protein B0T15DRAFT_552697 [Chaetomium strumarium]|uniref:Uncharacterized protein n=1 Tax=Chaetomium strumarium TaxID=1170767 RepID=A0AAJ0GV47_9PEZI|nr:hypothetical protein B0T15DRAFT_552697 [Chaetomium strumarium]